MSKKKIPMAIAYDFDGTLAPGNMQEHSFIPGLKIKKKDFWNEVKRIAQKNDMDQILAYMKLMLSKAEAAGKEINKTAFKKHGENLPFFKGVKNWFRRINRYAAQRNIKLKHFIISSGLRELIEGSVIKKEFECIFASGFMYDQHEVAKWPALAINYTGKTQYLFRINKGISNSYDDKKINEFTRPEDRPIPFSNMIYIGDGETDIPCMKMIKYQNGYAIAVYDPNTRHSKNKESHREKALKLLKDRRADYAVRADYTDGAELDSIVKTIIDKISAENKLASAGKK